MIKLLYIHSLQADYVQDLLYSGLVKTIGAENIYEVPYNFRYHFLPKKYPYNLGHTPSVSSLLRRKNKLDYSQFDAVVLASCKPDAAELYLKIAPQLPSSLPVILVDGGDQPEVGGDFLRTGSRHSMSDLEKIRPFDLIFKREYLDQHKNNSRLVSFPMSMNMDCLPRAENLKKKYDVSFWAVESDPIRTRALTLLQTQFDCQSNGTTLNQTFRKYARKGQFYLAELARCKVVLNVRGVGWDTLRYWECPAMGVFMVTQKPRILIPNDFQNNVHVVHCKDDLSDLVEICQHYLTHETERETIARAAHEHLLQFHTNVHRAKGFVQKVQSLL